MSTSARSPISLRAQFLGPVFSLDAQLSVANQNLIFARNGTGKSFLSRAFRYLDLHGQQHDITDASKNLISDEALDGKGSFAVSCGDQLYGELHLDQTSTKAILNETIFHVFSEDFVQDELRERQFILNGQIENQIAVDRDDIKQKELTFTIDGIEQEIISKTEELRSTLDTEKTNQLNKRAAVNRSLREFAELTSDRLLTTYTSRPEASDKTLADVVKDLNTLKAIPLDPQYPDAVTPIRIDDVKNDEIRLQLLKITSPSTIAEEIKKRIDEHHEFYEEGTRLLKQREHQSCPFCDQAFFSDQSKRLIDAYSAYFNDAEESHKSKLRELFRSIKQKENELDLREMAIVLQKSRYDELKSYLPSTRSSTLDDVKKPLLDAKNSVQALLKVIEKKALLLSEPMSLDIEPLQVSLNELNRLIDANDAKVIMLRETVARADNERKAIQRVACTAFENEFVRTNWNLISAIADLKTQRNQRSEELNDLNKLSPSLSARERVADTFEMLLNSFFSAKYTFNRETFVLTRSGVEMKRGPHRTLSDGEKTALAFCYFVASIHKKMGSNSDYSKVYLVFDDPVTSMSYDYIYSIAQVLKDLSVSKVGHLSINPRDKATGDYERPRILILTHSTYLFNICRTNRVVKDGSTFCLEVSGARHRLAKQEVYIAPFERQLADIYRVANGEEPDHTTGNSVRSVLEAIGRFCRPDKMKDLTTFISFLAGECGITIRSVLINSLSHGTYYEYAATSDDVRTACKEAIEVVKKYAEGQLELIKA